MSDRSLLERFHRMVQIAPQQDENTKFNQNSWKCDGNLLTTEQKIFAISNGYVKSDIDEIRRIGRENNSQRWKKVFKKYLKKCPWSFPWIMITISAIQVSMYGID